MSVRREQKQESHERIVESAARLLRERGVDGAGVADIMREAGLTHGGFYAHFGSRDDLVAEALSHAADQSRSRLFARLSERRGVAWLREAVRRYLSPAHRDNPAQGCPLTSFGPDVARRESPTEVRKAFDRELETTVAGFREHLDEAGAEDPDGRALALIALCAGGLTLSRAVDDRRLSDRILRACRALAEQGSKPMA
ncbi:MAG: TetR/AcrR family transcriptional regulator [Candidatus Binatia bacterium]